MTLQEFKCETQRRGHNYDNSANAAAHWAKSWGLTDAIMRIKASRRKNRRQEVHIRQLSLNFAV